MMLTLTNDELGARLAELRSQAELLEREFAFRRLLRIGLCCAEAKERLTSACDIFNRTDSNLKSAAPAVPPGPTATPTIIVPPLPAAGPACFSSLRGASEAIEAHNLEQLGSTPSPATNPQPSDPPSLC